MQIEHTADLPPGAMRVQLGPVERWVVISLAGVLLSIVAAFAGATMQRLDRLSDQQVELSKQQAVANSQLAEVAKQLADVPGLKERVTALEVQVQSNTKRLEGKR